MVHGKQPLTLRGSIYMGYGETFLIDGPQGPQRNGQLWGTGFGFAASIGSYAEARFMFSWPLISTIYTEAYQPRFDFSISAQF
jgi:hemolysin activation/secretion protein